MRRDGIAYTAGVLVSFAAMAAVVIAIRASVGEVSWGFQFQSPVFSLLIAYLFFVVGLNLSGVFEIGGRFAGVGQGLAARGGTTGAFFTGVLAVDRGHALHRALHGRGAGLCAQPARAADRGRAAGAGAGPRPALSRAVDDAGAAAPDAAAGPVDGPAAPVPRLPDVRLGRLDDLGADPADRRRRRDLCAGRHDPDRLRDLAAAHRQRRLGSPPGCVAAWRPPPCCWPSPPRSSSRTVRPRPHRPPAARRPASISTAGSASRARA